MVMEEMEQAREINLVMKCDWVILFLKEGKECVPVVESGWDKDVVSGTFMHFRVVLDDGWNDECIVRWLETQDGLHHAN